MDTKRAKFLLLGGGIVACMVFLVLAGMNRPGGFAYYLSVSEFKQAPDQSESGFRVNGKVVDGSIQRLPTGQDVTFEMTDGSATLAVRYHGIIPDTFVDGADVVVEGSLQANGEFAAHTLLAKCPSKYESADDSPSDKPLEISSAG